jgi:dTDP-4-dehydrorhamnose reductase
MWPTIWITGAGGLIGNCLVQSAREFAPGANVIGLTRARLDLADFEAVRQQFHRDQPNLVIHCAALSQSQDCQANPPLARKLNVEVTRLLAELAADIPLVFFSTDLVFDGREGNYSEQAPVNPLSVYGETKAAAERIVLVHPRHIVIRTSLNGGVSPAGSRGFNEQLRRAWEQGQTMRLFTDEFRSPIPASVTARAAWEIVRAGASGLRHVAGAERLSRWQIGQLIAARWPQLRPRLEPASLTEHQGAPRAPDTSLDCAKAQALLSFPLPGLTEWLAAHREEPF